MYINSIPNWHLLWHQTRNVFKHWFTFLQLELSAPHASLSPPLVWPQQCVHFHRRRAPYRWPVRNNPSGLCNAWPTARLSHFSSLLPRGADGWCSQYSFSPSVLDARPAAVQNCQLLSVEKPEMHEAVWIYVICTSNFTWGSLHYCAQKYLLYLALMLEPD